MPLGVWVYPPHLSNYSQSQLTYPRLQGESAENVVFIHGYNRN